MNKQKHFMINLNTAVDLAAELRENGRIDRETESLFVSLLYKAREYNFYKNPKRIKSLTEVYKSL